jgi:hypothetical protein
LRTDRLANVYKRHTFMVHLMTLRGQQIVDASMAETPAFMGQLD